MKYKILPVAMILTLMISLPAMAKQYELFYLGGQSNMDGHGYVNQLPTELNASVDGVMIFHGNTSPDVTPIDGKGLWTQLKPGHGVGFSSDGKTNTYSDRVGVELTFALKLKELYPDSNIAIIKYSRGGTSIDRAAAKGFGCWEPDFQVGGGVNKRVNQYDHFLATVRNATSINDIDKDGQPDTLIPRGIVWMQGESDACYTEDIALRYEANLKRLMDLIRAAFRTDDLPVVIGRISDSEKDKKIWTHSHRVRQAQKDFTKKDPAAAMVTTTDNYGYSDPWHYDTKGYIDLGKQFAAALQQIK